MDLHRMMQQGFTHSANGFLSAFYTLIGTHAVHLLFGLLWIPLLLYPVARFGVTDLSVRRLTCLTLFWQFINTIWMLIFTFVYLMGGV
jgi:cytochrome o ubiquinol oxidase subunit 3